MQLSTGNIIAILSLMVAIPCTAIMVWKVFRRQQRDSHDTRRILIVLNFVDPISNVFKMTEPCCHYIDNLVGGPQAVYRILAYSLVLVSKLECWSLIVWGPRRVGTSNHFLTPEAVTYALGGMHCTQVEGQITFGLKKRLRMD